MNLLHMKYAVQIAETHSINKAAEILYVGQSALSRAIKELESSLGVTLFERSSKGMILTPNGEVFVRYAKSVLHQIDEIENLFSDGAVNRQRFSISVPRASYITDAFAKFSNEIAPNMQVELFYRETNAMHIIKSILQEDYKLGIVRYASDYDRYYKELMAEKGLDGTLITEFRYLLLINTRSPLATKPELTQEDLHEMIEISHADAYVPTLSETNGKKEEVLDNANRHIYVFERGSQFELLSQNPETYMWVSPVPQDRLDQYGLVQRACKLNPRRYKDVLIRRKEYELTPLDQRFIEHLIRAKREIIGTSRETEF